VEPAMTGNTHSLRASRRPAANGTGTSASTVNGGFWTKTTARKAASASRRPTTDGLAACSGPIASAPARPARTKANRPIRVHRRNPVPARTVRPVKANPRARRIRRGARCQFSVVSLQLRSPSCDHRLQPRISGLRHAFALFEFASGRRHVAGDPCRQPRAGRPPY